MQYFFIILRHHGLRFLSMLFCRRLTSKVNFWAKLTTAANS